MLLVKAPLRISIGGGGTDLSSYYSRFGCSFTSAAIDKYVYISLHKIFLKEIILKYSELERVEDPELIKHPIIRECLKKTGVRDAVEICSFADIPAGSGLGSSSTFTVALLKALYTYTNHFHNNLELAEDACNIEIDRLNSPIGKQDQYISALGGLTRFKIDTTGQVKAEALKIDQAVRTELEDHLLLFFTGYTRDANEILAEQKQKTLEQLQAQDKKAPGDISSEMLDNLHFVRELGAQIDTCLENGNLNEFARLMDVHWQHKKKRSGKMSRPEIDQWYQLAMQNGALGGKLIGAGGGGFLMFFAEDKRRVRRALREAGMQEIPFRFDMLGARVVLFEQ